MSADAEHAKRDSLLGVQVRVATDSADDWQKTKQPKWLKRQWARLYAAADSLTGTKASPPVDTTPPPPPNAAPVARFSVSPDATNPLKVTFDARTSTDDKAVTGYAWDCGALPNCTGTGSTLTFTYPHEGPRTVKLTVRDAEGLTGSMSRTFTVAAPVDTIVPVPPDTTTPKPPVDTGLVMPARPRSVPDASPKPCATVTDVPVGANFQTVLNTAASSVTAGGLCLDLAPNAEFVGNFTLPTRSCSAFTAQNAGWITIRTKGIPDSVGVQMIPRTGLAKLTQAFNQYALITGHPTCRWNIINTEIRRAATNPTTLVYHLIVLGDGGGAGEGNTSLDKNPTDIIVRRNWIHGTVDGELVRCVVINGIRQAVVDNWIDECHASGFDSQAVEGWNGAGPFLVQHNFLAGAGENLMFGGADARDSTMVPQDATLLNNHFYKDLAWKGKWSIKNGLEFKNVRRVLAEGNVLDPCAWVGSQVGFCVVVKSATGSLSSTLVSGTTDVTFQYNKANSANRGFNVQGRDCSGQMCEADIRVSRVYFFNNLFTNIGTSNGIVGNDGWLIPTTNAPNNLLYRNNTIVGNTPDRGLTLYLSGDAGLYGPFHMIDNIFAGQGYYAIGADCPQPTHQAALDCMLPGMWKMSGNVVTEVDQTYWAKNPAGNTYLVSINDLGLTSDYRAPKYPGKGANIDLVNAKTSGVVNPAGLAARTAVLASAPRALGARARYVPTKADSAYMATQPKSDNINITKPAKNPPPRSR